MPQVEADVIKLAALAEAANAQDGRAPRRWVGLVLLLTLHLGAQDHGHEIGEIDIGDPPGGDEISIAQHRVLVGNLEHLGQAVGYVDDAGAVRRKRADRLEQQFRLGTADRRGRLVHDEDVAAITDRLGDLDELGLRKAQRTHVGGRLDMEPQPLQQLGGHGVQSAIVDDATRAARLAAEEQVLRHRHARNR